MVVYSNRSRYQRQGVKIKIQFKWIWYLISFHEHLEYFPAKLLFHFLSKLF
jgi:hypothetical protein